MQCEEKFNKDVGNDVSACSHHAGSVCLRIGSRERVQIPLAWRSGAFGGDFRRLQSFHGWRRKYQNDERKEDRQGKNLMPWQHSLWQ